MKLNKLYIGLLLMAGSALAACSDLLDTHQLGVTNTDDFYNTDQEAEEATVAIYGALSDAYGDFFMLKNCLSDDVWCGGGGRGDNVNYEVLNEYRFTADASFINSYFTSLYKIVYRANLVLNNIQPESAVKQKCIAEAHVFRAFAYFELVTLWGNAPLITEAERTDLKVHNSTPDALWALIEDDLEAAINPKVLPEKTSLDDNITSIRITHQLAQALLGKAYVFQGKYAEAMTILDEVIDSGKFDLFQGNISDLFIAANNNNRESMFVVNKVNDPSIYDFGFVSIMTGWRPEKFDNLFALSASGALDVYTNGFGYLNPTKELYEAFVDEEGEDGYRLNETIKTYKRMNSELGLQLASGEYYYGSEGYFSWKHRSSPQNYVQGTWAGFWNNDYIMRFAEVLLLAAEAHIQGGGTRADEYINRIRERAQLAPISGATMDDLKKEKRLELCIESVRFQDLVRWGDAATLLKDQGKQVPALYGIKDDGTMDIRFTWTNADAGFVAGKHDLLPFPQAEINVNPNIEQNPNW